MNVSSAQPLKQPLATCASPSPDVQTVDATLALEAQVPAEHRPTWPFRLAGQVSNAADGLFGFASLVFGLAVVTTIPVIQLLGLGYLLEASGRVARSGRLRDGFVGVRKAGRIGGFALGTWLVVLPLRLIADLWYNSHLIDSEAWSTHVWRGFLLVAMLVMAAHVVAAWYAGGRLRQFLWPLIAPFMLVLWLCRSLLGRSVRGPELASSSFLQRLSADISNVPPLHDWFLPAVVLHGLWHGRWYSRCRDDVWDFLASLNLPHYFWLGFRGFCAGGVWLFPPILLLAAGTALPNGSGVLLGWIGALTLTLVVSVLPLIQTSLAADNRLSAAFRIRQTRRLFARAPVACWMAVTITLASALPLYLLRIEVTPDEVLVIPALVFVVFIYPARLLSGWAAACARRRERPAHFLWRWSAKLATLPVAAFYVLVVFFTQYTSWYGVWSLFEQHAFLIPAPFTNW